jgi:uncharacterized damage-inducible protein DinB
MTQGERIADELRRSLSGPAWHGPSLDELLRDITAEQASWRAGDVHTIHELVLHISTWQRLALDALSGAPMPHDLPPAEDWREAGNWVSARNELEEMTNRLAGACSQLTDEQIARIVPGRDFSAYVLLHGVAQHHAYHGGQIAIIRKLLHANAL